MTTPTVVPAMPALERPAFFDGQRLDAADLASIQDYHRELRWLHNRTLHDWGIAVGYVVTGRRGAAQVSVTPGYALDCDGHDLVLAQGLTLAVPAVAGTASGQPMRYYLTVSYASDDQLPPSESRDGVCLDGGAVRRAEAPRIRWQNPVDLTPDGRWRRGLDIVLATVQIQDCALAADVSTAERRQARPAAQPYVAAGRTPTGSTPWRFYPSASAPLGVETVVDTSAAAFSLTPAYTAQVEGTRVLKSGQLIDGFATVVDPSPTDFVLRVALPRDLALAPYTVNPSAAVNAALLPALQQTLRWHVAWMGVEGQG